jgi:alkylhydroperoxidase family enzyme
MRAANMVHAGRLRPLIDPPEKNMPRIKELTPEEMPKSLEPSLQAVFGAVRDKGTLTGTPGNWWTVWARVPEILSAFSAYSYANAPVDPKLREIALIRTGYVRGSQFVYSQHCKVARKVGVEEEKIAAIPYWQIANVYDEAERACLAYVDGLMLENGRVHDAVFDLLKKHLGEENTLILTYIINMYSLHAISTKALRLEYDDVPERVTEIPVPETQRVQDWNGKAAVTQR